MMPRAVRTIATAIGVGLCLLSSASPAMGASPARHQQPTTTSTADQSLTTTPPLDTGDADAGNQPGLDLDRITGPRYEDGVVTSTTFWPLGIAAVAILVVFVVIFYRAARGKRSERGT